jgi:SH3-like domain-containing protein
MFRKLSSISLIFILIFFTSFKNSLAQSSFGYVNVSRANVRNGPGKDYAISFTLQKKNIPIKLLNQTDDVFLISDYQNQKGWIKKSLVSVSDKKRYGLIINDSIVVCRLPELDGCSHPVLIVDKNNIVKLLKCHQKMCRISINQITGWVDKESIFGVELEEIF